LLGLDFFSWGFFPSSLSYGFEGPPPLSLPRFQFFSTFFFFFRLESSLSLRSKTPLPPPPFPPFPITGTLCKEVGDYSMSPSIITRSFPFSPSQKNLFFSLCDRSPFPPIVKLATPPSPPPISLHRPQSARPPPTAPLPRNEKGREIPPSLFFSFPLLYRAFRFGPVAHGGYPFFSKKRKVSPKF